MKRFVCLLLPLFAFFGIRAQTLNECQQAAERNYPLIKRMDLIRQTTDLTMSNIQKGWLPQLSATAQSTYQSDVTAFPEQMQTLYKQMGISMEGLRKDQYRVGIDVQQLVFDGGAIKNQKEMARLQGAVKSAYNFVPAIMGMLLMLICAMMTSVSIVREKEKGTMEVLLVSPVRPIMMIVAKAVPYLVLAFAILVSILLMARYVLGVPLAGSILWIFLVSAIYILLALSLGFLISNIATSQLMALLLSAMVLLMPIVMLSGMLFPIESMPTVLQWISAVIPPRYYIEAMRKLMIMGVGIGEVMREVVILSGMTAFLLIVSLAKFKTRLE